MAVQLFDLSGLKFGLGFLRGLPSSPDLPIRQLVGDISFGQLGEIQDLRKASICAGVLPDILHQSG
jgi:hypothetical protein